jgi:hypothetical protein
LSSELQEDRPRTFPTVPPFGETVDWEADTYQADLILDGTMPYSSAEMDEISEIPLKHFQRTTAMDSIAPTIRRNGMARGMHGMKLRPPALVDFTLDITSASLEHMQFQRIRGGYSHGGWQSSTGTGRDQESTIICSDETCKLQTVLSNISMPSSEGRRLQRS